VKSAVDWLALYTQELGPLKGHGPWRAAVCPFHSDGHPSLRVNVEHGGHCCMACEARGDGVRFLMERDGLTFNEALDRLKEYSA
jgi:DNA primase